jgi:hypothetical protein
MLSMIVYLIKNYRVFELTNTIYRATGEQFSGVLKYEHKLLASEIWTLVQTRQPAVFLQREVIK